MWRVACGTQDWIQLVCWFWLIPVPTAPLARAAMCIMGKWRAAILCCLTPLTGSCSETGTSVMGFWLELRRAGWKDAWWHHNGLVGQQWKQWSGCLCVCVYARLSAWLLSQSSYFGTLHWLVCVCYCAWSACMFIHLSMADLWIQASAPMSFCLHPQTFLPIFLGVTD